MYWSNKTPTPKPQTTINEQKYEKTIKNKPGKKYSVNHRMQAHRFVISLGPQTIVKGENDIPVLDQG